MKIDENGYPGYTIESVDGKEYGPIYVTELKKYKKLSKKIEENLENQDIDTKKLDPFLMNIMTKKLKISYKDAAKMILEKKLDFKYDMKNLKKMPGLLSRYRYRIIARAAEKNGIEVENLEDSPLEKLEKVPKWFTKQKEKASKWFKNQINNIIDKKETLKLDEGSNIKRKISNKVHKQQVKNSYKVLKKAKKLANKAEKLEKKARGKLDRLGYRTTKTESDKKREKLEEDRKEKTKEIIDEDKNLDR